MSLSDPYFVYGYLKNTSGEFVSGKEIKISDSDNYQGDVSVITDGNGYFQVNIQDVSSNNDTIEFKVFGISRNQFTLNINDPFKHVDVVIPTYVKTSYVDVDIGVS